MFASWKLSPHQGQKSSPCSEQKLRPISSLKWAIGAEGLLSCGGGILQMWERRQVREGTDLTASAPRVAWAGAREGRKRASGLLGDCRGSLPGRVQTGGLALETSDSGRMEYRDGSAFMKVRQKGTFHPRHDLVSCSCWTKNLENSWRKRHTTSKIPFSHSTQRSVHSFTVVPCHTDEQSYALSSLAS